jgi:hypothetical protein
MTPTEREPEVVALVERLTAAKDYGAACIEVAVFVEKVTCQAFLDLTGAEPKNAAHAIDSLMSKGLLPRLLGYKLHAVREARNAKMHGHPYTVSAEDARLAVDALNQLLEWSRGGEMAAPWRTLVKEFAEHERLLLSPAAENPDQLRYAVMGLHRVLYSAIFLKVKSLGLREGRGDLFSLVSLLKGHGIDVSCAGWGLLTEAATEYVHPRHTPSPVNATWLRHSLPDLRRVLSMLRPPGAGEGGTGACPQVSPPPEFPAPPGDRP